MTVNVSSTVVAIFVVSGLGLLLNITVAIPQWRVISSFNVSLWDATAGCRRKISGLSKISSLLQTLSFFCRLHHCYSGHDDSRYLSWRRIAPSIGLTAAALLLRMSSSFEGMAKAAEGLSQGTKTDDFHFCFLIKSAVLPVFLSLD